MIQYYYPNTIKNILVAFMDMFNDLKCVKYDSSGTAVEDITVPIMYGPIDKPQRDRLENHYYDANDQEFGDRFYQMIPRISIMLDGIVYDPNRAYGVNEWRYWLQETMDISGSDIENMFADYQPTPYNLACTMYIKTNSLDYFAQLMENILPYFNPKLMLSVKEFSFLNIERDLPVSLGSVTPEFIDEMSNPDRREVNATLSFNIEAFLYRPWSASKIIKIINSKYFIGSVPSYDTSGNPVITSANPGTYQVSDYSTTAVNSLSGMPDPLSAVPVYFDFSATYDSDAKDFFYYKTFSAMNET